MPASTRKGKLLSLLPSHRDYGFQPQGDFRSNPSKIINDHPSVKRGLQSSGVGPNFQVFVGFIADLIDHRQGLPYAYEIVKGRAFNAFVQHVLPTGSGILAKVSLDRFVLRGFPHP